VESLDARQVLFIPDRNLGRYVARFTKKEILPWEGFCIVHDRYTPDEVREARKRHPDAEVLVHPECRPEVIDLADHVFSTSGIIRHVGTGAAKEYVIGTEVGILHRIRKLYPDRSAYPLARHAVCVNMKKTTLPLVRAALERMAPRIEVDPPVADRARRAIERMLAL
jgi:quinolinate synthase